MALSWLPDGSLDSIHSALDRAARDLSGRSITLLPWLDQSNPTWWRRSARLNDGWIVKFAWSEPAAERVWHEAQVLRVLDSQVPALRTPRVIASSDDPVLLVTKWVKGAPLTHGQLATADRPWLEDAASDLAEFLGELHRGQVLAELDRAIGSLPTPEPQATTAAIRRRLSPWLRADQTRLMTKWCDWVDQTLVTPQNPVFVQGDLHGHNQVWDPMRPILRLVVDFEESGVTDATYDFRYLPSQGPGIDFLVATVARYAEITGKAIDIARVMAWNVRTVLGDALWRSEAGIPLPDGGTPSDWADGLQSRFIELGITI
jgi:aminoglycoside phosphotransferase